MDLSEDKAKEILDFLAREAGYCKLFIRRKYSYEKSRQFVVACKVKLELDDTLYDLDHQLYAANRLCPNFLIVSLKSMSYVNALKTILKLSKDGKDIFCRNSLMLPAYTSLEEIIIKMDLKDGLDRK